MSSRWDAPPAAGSSNNTSASSDPAAAAAAAAARIAAQYGAGSSSASSSATASTSQALTTLKSNNNNASTDKRREGNEAPFNDFVDINDIKNRYMITRGPTQQQIHQETGASLTTKGHWYPDRNLATPDKPPLYIHVEAMSEEMLQKALARIKEIINSEAPQLIEERGMRGKAPTPQGRDGSNGPAAAIGPPERRKWNEERLPIGLESLRNFNVRAKIVGPGGVFVKYIQNETGTRVQIKGRGSGFIETDTGREADDEMFIHVTGPDDNQIAEAKTLSEDLLDAVRGEWEKARQVLEQAGFAVPPAGGWPKGPAGPRAGGGAGASPGGYGQQQQQQGGYGSPAIGAGGYGQPQQPQAGGYGGAPGGYGAAAAGGYGAQQQPQQSQQNGWGAARSPQQAAPAAATVPTPAVKTPEEEALDKYWRDYIKWEDSFKAYHGKLPSKEEGGQDVPARYRS